MPLVKIPRPLRWLIAAIWCICISLAFTVRDPRLAVPLGITGLLFLSVDIGFDVANYRIERQSSRPLRDAKNALLSTLTKEVGRNNTHYYKGDIEIYVQQAPWLIRLLFGNAYLVLLNITEQEDSVTEWHNVVEYYVHARISTVHRNILTEMHVDKGDDQHEVIKMPEPTFREQLRSARKPTGLMYASIEELTQLQSHFDHIESFTKLNWNDDEED